MKEYHDSLLSVQNVLLSFKLVGDMDSTQNKYKMISQMLTYLLVNHENKKIPAVHSAEKKKKEPK